MDRSIHLVLFTRIPVPGRSKTRLQPVLSPTLSAELQYATLLDQAERLASLELPLTVCYTDDGCDAAAVGAFRAAVQDRALGTAVHFERQRGEDLGARMAAAIDDELARGAAGVLLMGSDLPLVTPAVLREALEVFASTDVLLCPSSDGGYWAVGLRASIPALFTTGGYGGPSVCERARTAAREAGYSVALGPTSRDIDTPADLMWLLGLGHDSEGQVGPCTCAVLELIETTEMAPGSTVGFEAAESLALPLARAPNR